METKIVQPWPMKPCKLMGRNEMGLFDWIPTVGEVIDFLDCRLVGHTWVRHESGIVYCKVCGKRKI